jgi:hypothetical protein
MRELLIVRRNCAVWEALHGRRDLRPGCIVEVDERIAEKLVASGSAERLVKPAPLFEDAAQLAAVPKRRQRKT